MNLKEHISRILKEETSDLNILNKPLKVCGKDPVTGYFKDGYCKTNKFDTGTHTVCAKVNDEFLEFTKSMGNDLSTPTDGFSGLESGDRWCLCANRWKEAYDEGMEPEVIKSATNIKTLDIIGDIIFEKDLNKKYIKEEFYFINESKDWGNYKDKLQKTFSFKDFNESMNFVNKVAKIAEKQKHHPDIKINYDKVIISITDHEKGGVSDKCHKFVNEVNKLNKDSQEDEITEYSRTLKNARQQGVGLRFPKSAIKANPSRFRPYNR